MSLGLSVGSKDRLLFQPCLEPVMIGNLLYQHEDTYPTGFSRAFFLDIGFSEEGLTEHYHKPAERLTGELWADAHKFISFAQNCSQHSCKDIRKAFEDVEKVVPCSNGEGRFLFDWRDWVEWQVCYSIIIVHD
jgi:hypothetical protein